MRDRVGNIIDDRFVLRERIGDGRMSSVYLASDDASDGAEVVVKLLDTAHPDEIKRELFKRETTSLETLNHPNIARLAHSGWSESAEAFYLVLDYFPYSLDMYLKGEIRAQLRDFDIYRTMRELAEALAHAHSKNIVHRDIKPSNILLDHSGAPFLADFGISKMLTDLTVGETLAGYWSGGYASPEQRARKAVGPESDVYSLGAVFYHMLSGQSPPADGPTPDLVDKSVTAPPPLKNALKRILSENPDERTPAGASLQSTLEITRRMERLPSHYLILTNNAIRDIVSSGYVLSEDWQTIVNTVKEDLGGPGWDDEVHVQRDRRTEGDIVIMGAGLRLICAQDEEGGDALAVKAVHSPHMDELEAWRRNSMPYRAKWAPVRGYFRSEQEPSELQEATAELTEMLSKLSTYERVETVSKEKRNTRSDFIEKWDVALNEARKRIEADEPSLRYSNVTEDGGYLRFRLAEESDDIAWEGDAPLAVRGSGDGRHLTPVGNLVDIRGRVVIVARDNWNSRGQDSRQLPKTGFLTTNTIEVQSAHSRQQNAVRLFRNRDDMPNPKLADAIAYPSAATRTSAPEVEFFQDRLSDDKKDAVRRALASNELFLIQGPPGTGKTAVIAEIALQILKKDPDARILLTSQSNVAVDHALTRIADAAGDSPPEMIRLGRTDKIGYGGEDWTLKGRSLALRREVVAKCEPIIDEMRLEARAIRAAIKADGATDDSEPEDGAIPEEWVAEARSLLEQLNEYEAEYESARRDPTTSGNLETMAATVERTRAELKDVLDSLVGLLTNPADTENASPEETLDMIIRATSPSDSSDSESEDEDTRRLRRTQELRKTVDDWTKVVGFSDDFHKLIGNSARVVAATCLYSGRRGFGFRDDDAYFDWAIIDEAGRATAPEALIPIVKSRRAILVGDERQLPPMLDEILSEESTFSSDDEDRLDKSLFQSLVEEVEKSGGEQRIASLKTQYRMRPEIGNLISETFYDGNLENGSLGRRRGVLDDILAPVSWITTSSMPDKQENRMLSSYANPLEVNVIRQILDKMRDRWSGRGRLSVGVITGYSTQVERLTNNIQPDDSELWRDIQIEVATVDSFQGRECDVVIYSTVRSNREQRIGFLRDVRRVNVALSRARNTLIIVGDARMMRTAMTGLERNPFASVLEHIQRRPYDECRMVDARLVEFL